MALQVGDKVVYAGNSPFSHSTAINIIVDIKTINKDDRIKLSIGVRRLLERKGSLQVCLTEDGKKNGTSYLPYRFFKRIPVVKSGSFMLVEDVKEFRKNSEIFPIIYAQDFVEIGGNIYVPTEKVQKHITKQEWRILQCHVVTLLV